MNLVLVLLSSHQCGAHLDEHSVTGYMFPFEIMAAVMTDICVLKIDW